MDMTPANPDGEYGISTVTSGITVEFENITETPLAEPVPDQKNATVKEIYYDTRKDLKLTYRGTKLTETAGSVGGENKTVTYNGVKYYVESHEQAGTYKDLKRWNLSAHRFDNAPAQPAQQPSA